MKNQIRKKPIGFIFSFVFILSSCLLGFAQIAFSNEHSWNYIALDLNTSSLLKDVFFDKNSYQDLGDGNLRAITKWLYHLKDPKSNSETNYQIDLSEYNCNTKTINILSLASYNQLNNVLEDFRPERPISIEILEGSPNQQILEFICQKSIENRALETCKLEKNYYLETKIIKNNKIKNLDFAEETLKECLHKQGVKNLNLIDSLK